MYVNICNVRVKKGTGPRFEQYLAELSQALASHPGALGFDLHRHIEDPESYTLIEKYADQNALHYHTVAEAGKVFEQNVSELMDGPVGCTCCEEVVNINTYK